MYIRYQCDFALPWTWTICYINIFPLSVSILIIWYWFVTGITADTINVLKQGNMDHSQKTCYHCNCKGHIKANCPARKRLDAKPWTKRPGPREKRTIVQKGSGSGKGRGKFSSKRLGPPRKKFTGSAQSIQQSEDFSKGQPKWWFDVGNTECVRTGNRR